MNEDLEQAITSLRAHYETINRKFRDELFLALKGTLLSLRNINLFYDCINDDIDWLEENHATWCGERIHWGEYIERHWKDRLNDATAIATAVCDAGDWLEFRVRQLCKRVEQIVARHQSDGMSYSDTDREIVSFLQGAVAAVKTLVDAQLEDPLGFYDGERLPLWIELVRYVASTFPQESEGEKR